MTKNHDKTPFCLLFISCWNIWDQRIRNTRNRHCLQPNMSRSSNHCVKKSFSAEHCIFQTSNRL